MLSFPLSFDIPMRNERLWSIGYTAFKYPKDGIPMKEVVDGKFNWQRDYGHKLRVVEAKVKRIFCQKFANGFVGGPCFSISREIFHGQSGGPTINPEGFVKGINSAGASTFFQEPVSLISLLYPLLLHPIRFGAQSGPVRINAKQTFLDQISNGFIRTDGSEENLHLDELEHPKGPIIGGRFPKKMKPFVHDDFQSFQKGLTATTITGPVFRLRKVETKNK